MEQSTRTAELFRSRGLRCTPQRFAVLDFLLRNPAHPTAEEIFLEINRADPRASRATIYNNLRTLIEAGLVREFAQEKRSARFGAQVEKHHHFICERCGRIEDIDWFEVKGIPRAKDLGPHTVREYELVLRGVCQACSTPRRKKTSKTQRST